MIIEKVQEVYNIVEMSYSKKLLNTSPCILIITIFLCHLKTFK